MHARRMRGKLGFLIWNTQLEERVNQHPANCHFCVQREMTGSNRLLSFRCGSGRILESGFTIGGAFRMAGGSVRFFFFMEE